MANLLSGITIDCTDPVRLAAFWGALLDRPEAPSLPGWRQLGERGDTIPRINFQPVPEPKVGKARVHLDITVPELETAMHSVAELGGGWTGERHDYAEGAVAVMTDPEGNEFCLVQYYD
jgi:hypothetical protein